MFRRISIKSILTLFVVLLVLFVLVKVMDSRQGERTFPEVLVEIDAESVTRITIIPRILRGQPVDLIREEDRWMVETQGKRYNANPSLPGSMIDELNHMKLLNLAGIGKEQWEEYEVTDSLGTRVQVYADSEKVSDVWIGKFTYQTQQITSYVRLADEKEVYGVEGFLPMTFNREANTFRDQTVIKSDKRNWSRLQFTYADEPSFVLTRMEDQWMVDNQPADSTAVADYFSKIANLTHSGFTDRNPSGKPTCSLLIEGNNQMTPVRLEGFRQNEQEMILTTSQNEGSYFSHPELVEKIFVSREDLLKQP
jgi:hypothetical protein